MSEGWIKLHRKILKNALIHDSDYLALWIRLLLMASHEETFIIFNNSKMPIKSGSFITSRLKISKQSHIQQSKVERILKYLETEQQIEQVNLGTGRLISITNWDKYQTSEQVNEQPVNSQRTASEQPVNTIKNDKNVKKNTNTPSRAHGTLEELCTFAVELGLPASDGEDRFDQWEANGWVNGKTKIPIKDWKAAMRTLKKHGWLASQEVNSPVAKQRKLVL